MLGGYLHTKQLLQREIEKNTDLGKKICELEYENEQLRQIRKEAEHRATAYARTIRDIEIILNEKGQGSIIDRQDKIKEVLIDLGNQL